jgi:signal transduction histidine kinase
MPVRMGARIVLALAATLCATPLCTSASAQVVAPPRCVLTIHSGAVDFPSNPILDAGIREGLSRSDLPIDYFVEYFQPDLFPGEAASLAFSDYIRRKYQGRRIDVVIAITDSALRFVLEHRDWLFPDASVVFMGIGGPDEITSRGGGITGIKIGNAYAETLRLALELHPSTTRVFVVAKSAEVSVDAVQNELRDFTPAVNLTYLNEPTIPALIAAIKAVPRGSLILYIWHLQLEPGHVVYPDKVAPLVAEAASVPVYCTSDLYMGSGVVGGVMRSTRATGVRMGEMALRILTGTSAQDIPTATAQVTPVLDWRQIRRWGISESRVPVGSIIMFREASAWERYKFYIVGAAALMLAQTALIAGLLVQMARRRHAEEQVRGSQVQLRRSYERIRDLGARLLNAQETERSRIARELHDDISQQMALLTIDLELLSRTDPTQAERQAGEALNRAQDVAKSVHDLSHRLHPAKLRLIGLVAALHALPHELSASDIDIVFTHDAVPPSLSPDLTLCLFRVVQEALQNAIKYSGARQVSVHLSGGSEGLALTIVDDGVGFDVDAAWGKGLGLISMGERLEAVGGTLEIHSKPGAGTRLEVRVPAHVVPSSETATA